MDDTQWPTSAFEAHRPHLRAVAYRMLGSLDEADDAVQESWLRLNRSDISAVENVRAWLTTVVARICLDILRARTARREQVLDLHLPDPVVTADRDDAGVDENPELHALMADSIGLALLVVLDTLSPTERLAFVLHDVFGVPFDEIGPLLDRSPAAAKQLASRARRRLRENRSTAIVPRSRHREVVNAFLAASRDGDFERLVEVLDPDVVLRAESGGAMGPSQLLHGAKQVAQQALRFTAMARLAHPVLVNGAPGLLAAANGKALALLSVAVENDRIVEIDIIADPARLGRLFDAEQVARLTD
jgi:RNA polymerase sigma-70 factor (ECF subfamily)